jgi:hypothetical protein
MDLFKKPSHPHLFPSGNIACLLLLAGAIGYHESL